MTSNKFYEMYWSKEAPPENDPTTPIRKIFLQNTISKLKIKNYKILDAGCGSGYFCKVFKDIGLEVRGVDISEKALNKAKKLCPRIEFKTSDLNTEIPYPDKSFEMVWSSEVIEHIFNVYNYLKQINRVLICGGYYILTTPYHALMKNMLIVLFNFDKHFCNIEDGHIRFFTISSLHKLLHKFGFEIIELKRIGRIPPLAKDLYVVAKKIKDTW